MQPREKYSNENRCFCSAEKAFMAITKTQIEVVNYLGKDDYWYLLSKLINIAQSLSHCK